MKPNFYSCDFRKGIKRNLLLFLLSIFFAFSGYSQKGGKEKSEAKTQESLKRDSEVKDTLPVNAYYLAKKLYSFSRMYNPENPYKDSIEARQALSKLYYYAGTDEAGELQKLIGSSRILDTLLNKLRKAENYVLNDQKIIKMLSLKESKIPGLSELQNKLKSDGEVLGSLNNLKKYIDTSNFETRNDTIKLVREQIKNHNIRLIDLPYFNKIVCPSNDEKIFLISLKKLNELEDSISKTQSARNSNLVILFDSLCLTDKYRNLWIKELELVDILNTRFTSNLNSVQKQDAQITISVLESSSGSISGWKMPSEAEMIDAVATYIASRVKQETVLWFFDQMRKNTDRYDLITTAFPETMNLLQSSEVFDAPNMGSAWKYALSKDFIYLPKNILTSEWIKERIPKEQQKYLDLTSVAWEISELVDNRLSYRDLIKDLYLKHNLDEPKEIKNLTFTDSIISFMYAVSNELYVINQQSVRNLTYEELSSMPFGQLEIMLELLNMKYSNSIHNLFVTKENPIIRKEDKQKIAKWLGNSLLALSQFDKILQQIEQAKKNQDPKSPILFDGYNTWKLISLVVKSAIPANKESIYKKHLDRADDAFEIYHLLSEKNYAGAVSKTLELVDSLIYNEYLVIDTSLVKGDAPFLIPFDSKLNNRKEVCIDIKILDEQFAKRRVKPKKFPRIARYLDKAVVCVSVTKDNFLKVNDKGYLKLNATVLMKALQKDECDRVERRIKRLFKKMNRTALDTIIKNYKNWGGQPIDSSLVQFPINSIAAQAIISPDKKAMQMIMKLASFLNDVAISDNEKELKKVIESYALPPGSYKQKRNAWSSLTFNAFAGPYFGYETSSPFGIKTKDDKTRSFAWNYGISAPIAITYTKTFGKRIFHTSRIPSAYQNNADLIKIRKNNLFVRSNWSLSISLSFVDVGAIVSYRMTKTTETLDHSFKWEQFISPGLHIGVAIPKTPLVVQLGYQYTPKIRRIFEDTETSSGETLRKEEQIGMWRGYLGVFFDIPMVNLWMKTRSVKFE